jgi:hypothetical protein
MTRYDLSRYAIKEEGDMDEEETSRIGFRRNEERY